MSLNLYPQHRLQFTLGDLDTMLMPYYDESLTDERLDRLFTRLWRFLVP